MIDYIDFVPEIVELMTWRKPAVYESMKEVRARMRDWQESAGVKVINVETVLRPLTTQEQQGKASTNDSQMIQTPNWQNWPIEFLQVIRVWFDDGL
jgi:hypothetical protein